MTVGSLAAREEESGRMPPRPSSAAASQVFFMISFLSMHAGWITCHVLKSNGCAVFKESGGISPAMRVGAGLPLRREGKAAVANPTAAARTARKPTGKKRASPRKAAPDKAFRGWHGRCYDQGEPGGHTAATPSCLENHHEQTSAVPERLHPAHRPP